MDRWEGGARSGRAPFIGFTCFVCMLIPSTVSLLPFLFTAITLPDSPARRQGAPCSARSGKVPHVLSGAARERHGACAP